MGWPRSRRNFDNPVAVVDYWLLGLWSVGLLGLSLAFKRHIALTSDSLFLHGVFTDLIHFHGHWNDWSFMQAPGFFPDWLLYFFTFVTFKSAVVQVLVVSQIQVLMIFGALVYLFRKLNYSLKVSGAFGALFAGALILFQARTDAWLFFYTTNNHFSSLLFGILALGIFLDAHTRTPSRIRIIGGGLSGFLAVISSVNYVVAFFIPILVTLWLTQHFIKAGRFHRASTKIAGQWKILYGQIVGLVLGFGFNTILIPHQQLVQRFTLGPSGIAQSLQAFHHAAKNLLFSPSPTEALMAWIFVLYFICLLFTFIRLARSWRSLFEANNPHAFLRLFFIITVLLTPALVVVSGAAIDTFSYRYLSLMFTLALVVGLDWSITNYPRTWKKFEARIVLVVAVALLAMAPYIFGGSAANMSSYQVVNNCIATLKADGVKLESGVADYWYARGVSDLQSNAAPTLAAYNTLEPFFWMSSLGPLKDPKRYGINRYNYAIVYPLIPKSNSYGFADLAGSQFLFDARHLDSHLPEPTHVYSCTDSTMKIWYYNNNSLDTVIRLKIAVFLNKH